MTPGYQEACAALLQATKRLNSFEDLEGDPAGREAAFEKLTTEFQRFDDLAPDEIKADIDTLNDDLQATDGPTDTARHGDRTALREATVRLSDWSKANCGFDANDSKSSKPKFGPGEDQ